MNPAFEEVVASARTLPDPEKEELVRILISDLGEGLNASVLPAWIDEAESRYGAYLQGEMLASPISEAAARVRTRIST